MFVGTLLFTPNQTISSTLYNKTYILFDTNEILENVSGIALCIWTLLMDEMTGIYVMLIFLDGFLNFGQGRI